LALLAGSAKPGDFIIKEIPVEDTEPIRHLNQRELAKRWDVSEATLERWRSDGIGPVFLKLQGQVRYRIEDVEAYETDCLRRSTSKRACAGGVA
jgi:hypothetical protein